MAYVVASKAYNGNFKLEQIKNIATGSPMKNENTQPQIEPIRLPSLGLDLFLGFSRKLLLKSFKYLFLTLVTKP